MAGQFEAIPGGGSAVALDEVEIAIIRSLAVQLLELLGPGEEPVEGEDPLAALFTEGPTEPPSDPALARLFPEAYLGPDAKDQTDELQAASAEFRRFTENDLRSRKRADVLCVVRTLDQLTANGDGGAVLKLTADDALHWLGALNDLRITIGTRLDVSDDDENGDLYQLPDSDPRKPMVMAYLWLGALQETLVETLTPDA
ncbi:DUF2017 domain-containing protein [Streptomyces albipurpureus]|uniref:DUF2017 domain-containing protein n=1 Tax=Streptomyces albipurpureus TaxID=2897419 RepID=A0ABT0UUY6_9ACTN|nr:DUF2017 domain-containing protein [Streptomyces sp. CWNU-1]MCM2392236.1 DUF2017 domain-containing protein [Streptomyces sp. CWNU-1]